MSWTWWSQTAPVLPESTETRAGTAEDHGILRQRQHYGAPLGELGPVKLKLGQTG
jgi:hypothetical protein